MLENWAFGLRAACALALPPLLLAAAPSRDRVALMDRIEAGVALPNGAYPLAQYSRNYAFDGKGKVRAVYLVPSPRSPGGGCVRHLMNGATTPCSRGEARRWDALEAKEAASHAPAGARRWFRDARALPVYFDGGCAIVTFAFEVATDRFLGVACNASAALHPIS